MDSQNDKQKLIIFAISATVLILVLGISLALFNYSRTGKNQILVAGDVYMKFAETNALTIANAHPIEGPGEDYFEFTIEGKNNYNKPIWYEIDLQHGKDDSTRNTRIYDNLLKFRLVEIKNGSEQIVVNDVSYNNLTNQKIWVNTIDANTDNIEITYKLYMWISSETLIGNTEDAIYDEDTWNNQIYASINVNVAGDFKEKELGSTPVIAADKVKETVVPYSESSKDTFTGGLVAVNTDGGLYNETESSQKVREYRYSGPNVNNYIYFNCEANATEEDASSKCELWRIIGVFKDESGAEHVKIVRNDILTADIFPATYTIEGTTYDIKYVSGDYAYWDKLNQTTFFERNNWEDAGLQYWLNTDEDETIETSNKGYLSTLKGNTENMIEKTKYYLGTVTSNDSRNISDSPINAYINERAVDGCEGQIGPTSNNSKTAVETNNSCRVWSGNPAFWEGKVALMYPSDYGYSSSRDYWSVTMVPNSVDRGLINTSWLLATTNHDDTEWFLSPSSYYSNYATGWSNDGYITTSFVGINGGVRPSLYLISSIKITSGYGTEEQPYFLENY